MNFAIMILIWFAPVWVFLLLLPFKPGMNACGELKNVFCCAFLIPLIVPWIMAWWFTYEAWMGRDKV